MDEYAAKAFELEPNRAGVATTAGMIFKEHGKNREAQRYFARACQLDRLNEYAAVNLSEIYEIAERPKDALTIIDLYIQAGGQHPGLIWKGTQIAFRNDMPQEFLFHDKLYTENQTSYPTLDEQRIWAFAKREQFNDVLEALNKLDEQLSVVGLDRMFLRTLCQAELGDDSWIKTLDEALKWNAANSGEQEMQGIVGELYDPCERLWDHVCKLPQSDENRLIFEQFLFERGLVPSSLLDTDNAGDENAEQILFGYYRCILKQPLDPNIATFSGWIPIPREDKEYFVTWFVLAENEEQAVKLALEAQNCCYSIPAELVECEQLDSYYAEKPQVVFQDRRFRKYDKNME
jgi:hypothetical protein